MDLTTGEASSTNNHPLDLKVCFLNVSSAALFLSFVMVIFRMILLQVLRKFRLICALFFYFLAKLCWDMLTCSAYMAY